MAEIEVSIPQEETPRSPFQNVRSNGRAFNSPNWRTKSSETPASPSPRTNTSRSAFSRPGAHAPQANSDGRRLYVGNMPYTAKSEDVEALFKPQFSIECIDIAIDPFTGRNPSYCFVDMESKEQAERAMIELDGRQMLGRPVKIKPGVAKNVTERNGEAWSTQLNMDRWRTRDNTTAKVNEASKRVYVGGLPRSTDQEALKSSLQNFFQGYTIENVSKLFTPHPAKRFEAGDHYYLFVDFSSEDEAQKALDTKNGQQGPRGSPLIVRPARAATKAEERKDEEGNMRL
ncbi:hypothetical protein N7495_008999 [Penicillium taxi]|uniref:uncharacterized protein n=1 Tax=Penicillium taxi TaxID=168475 RepID=UPI00254574C2|nr:uncharacterized protein N7495_008999 [Penicillium taxi]KAJ5888958.1 hypothetical protein N7495_008999 [Penicillium taxi]